MMGTTPMRSISRSMALRQARPKRYSEDGSTSSAADTDVTSFWVEAGPGVIWPSQSSDRKGASCAW